MLKNRVGEIHTIGSGYEVEIVEYYGVFNCTIKLQDGTLLYNKNYTDIRLGRTKNKNHAKFYNVGFIGEGSYSSRDKGVKTKYYQLWTDVLKRGYCDKFKEKCPTYKDVTVCEEWYNFQNFAEWFEDNYIKDFHLDKDILIKGNKIYSPETCCFVPIEINCLFTNRKSKRGDLPIGVRKCGKNFVSQMTINNEKIYLGTFYTVVGAFEAYKTAKESYIKEVADKWKGQITEQVYQAMYDYKVEISD